MKYHIKHLRLPARLLSLLFALLMVLPMTLPAEAFMYPADPSNMSIQTYTLGGGNVNVYSSESLTGRIGSVYPSDLITIRAASGSAVLVNYPTARGTKTGWIPVSAVSGGDLNTGSSLAIRAGSSVPLYRHSGGSERIGSVSENDTCYVVYADANRAQMIIPVSGGLKLGWVSWGDMDASVWRAVAGGRTIADGDYKIYVSGSHAMDGAGGDNDVHSWTAMDVPQQDVTIRYCGGSGLYSVQFRHNGYYLDVCGGSSEPANIWCYPGNDSAAQRFYIASLGGGRYELFAACSGLAMDVAYGDVNTDGATIDQWRWHGQAVTLGDPHGGQSSVQSSSAMSDALYGGAGGRITCGFDGYTSTYGRHEGIDFAIGRGHAVYSLTDGVITRVARGSSSSLSTICVYNAGDDKTVIYLHSAPLSSLCAGETVSRGQQLATESSRGASAAHTHVEMRSGRQTAASVSRDSVLANEDPTSFWQSHGYEIR